jgi:hypothetical protein
VGIPDVSLVRLLVVSLKAMELRMVIYKNYVESYAHQLKFLCSIGGILGYVIPNFLRIMDRLVVGPFIATTQLSHHRH